MTEWIELKDLQAVAKAHEAGLPIEVYLPVNREWVMWAEISWRYDREYRVAPKPPVTVKLYA